MTGFGNAVIVGRITKDLEIKTTQSGKNILTFTVAYDHAKDQATFINCVAWGATAENINKYHAKGDLIAVNGKIEQDTWEKDGVKRTSLKVQVRGFDFMPNPKQKQEFPQLEQAYAQGKDVVLEDIDDKPIDLSQIPF